jgi:uncharacterized protein
MKLVPDEEVADADATEDEFVVYPQSRQTYNLDRHMRDIINFEVPMKPLCRELCEGLCPECGTNLNVERCTCIQRDVDPRWAELKKLRGNQ